MCSIWAVRRGGADSGAARVSDCASDLCVWGLEGATGWVVVRRVKRGLLTPTSEPHGDAPTPDAAEVLGYKIPRGAMCINNIYAVHYDPEIYPEPDKFQPERWLDKDPIRPRPPP